MRNIRLEGYVVVQAKNIISNARDYGERVFEAMGQEMQCYTTEIDLPECTQKPTKGGGKKGEGKEGGKKGFGGKGSGGKGFGKKGFGGWAIRGQGRIEEGKD